MSTPLQRAAMRLGAAHAYLASYQKTMRVLESENNMQLLAGPINMLLSRMQAMHVDVLRAAEGVMDDLQTEGGRNLLRAAIVDIVLNERQPGQRITAVTPMAETFARA